MDTEKCAALLCALREGTLARAAERLGYTPSGISRTIAALEEEVGFPLLHRGRHGVAATEACEALLPAIRQMVLQADRCRQTAAALQGLDAGTVTVGTNYSSYTHRMAQLIARFRTLHPAISFRLIEGTSSVLVKALHENRIDLCLISQRDGPHHWYRLRRDPLVLMLPPSHPLTSRRTVPLSILETERYIDILPGRETDNSRCLEAQHIVPRERVAGVEDCFSAMALAEAGLGVALVNRTIADELRGDVAFRPLDPPQYVEIGLASAPPEDRSPATQHFLSFLKQELSE